MSTDCFSWLHLTDFHYGLDGQDCLWPSLRQPFLDSLAELHERCGPWDAVLFTGDLVQSGESAQFERMKAEVLDPLWQKLDELGSGDAVLLAVPGNHDLYRPNPDDDDPAAHVNRVVLIDKNSARPPELCPLCKEVSVLIEDLDPIVVPVRDKHLTSRIHSEGMRHAELARTHPRPPPGLEKSSVA